jgi:predicted nucleic acid-binding Zn ribbon protein
MKCHICGKKVPPGSEFFWRGKRACSDRCWQRLKNRDKYGPIKIPKHYLGLLRT